MYKYCKNKDVILEIMDEVFCIIIKKAPKANYENCFSWICTIAKNQLMNYIKDFPPVNASIIPKMCFLVFTFKARKQFKNFLLSSFTG